MLEKLFAGGKLEKKVISTIESYLQVFYSTLKCLQNVFSTEDVEKTYCVDALEREADSLRREIISFIYKGAFLPYIRPNICIFIEITEKAFDALKTCAFEFRYLNKKIFRDIKSEILSIARINLEMCEILIKAFQSLKETNDIREKNLAIRICEKRIDEIKLDLTEKIKNYEITNFWEGKCISEFIESLVKISDIIEDASDYLYILDLSLK